MRLAPVCRGFAQMAHVLVPKDVATEAKLQQMTLHLVGFFDLKDVAPWTAEMVVDDGYASMMEIAGWMAVNIDESWAQTNRIGRLLLNDREGCGGLEKVRKRIKMAPSNKGAVGRDELAAAYASLLETKEFFNAVRVLRRGGFVTAGCDRLGRRPAHRPQGRRQARLAHVRRHPRRRWQAAAASAAARHLTHGGPALRRARCRRRRAPRRRGDGRARPPRRAAAEALDGGRERGFFREALRALKRHAVVKNSATFAGGATTLAADYLLIVFRPDPATKGCAGSPCRAPGEGGRGDGAQTRERRGRGAAHPRVPLYYTAALHPLSGRSTTIGS